MPQIRFEKVSFGYTDTLFHNVNLSIGDYDRIGVVGNNGCGKSTFLQCIAGLIEPQEGRITGPKGLNFGFIEQDVPQKLQHMLLFDFISEAIPAYDRNQMAWKVDITLDIFKTPANIRQKPIKELSGGWQRLALIARTVLSQPEFLLLDEPTNHLDIAKILVLEQWLNEQVYDIPLICISHDRSFLANCTSKTIFLRNKEIRAFNYSYEQALQLLKEEDQACAARRSKEIKELNRLKKSAHDLRQIGVNNYSAAALKKSIQIAKRAENIENQLTSVHVEEKRALKLSNSGIQSKKLIGVEKQTIYSPNKEPLFYIEQLDILQGDRLIIFGANGSGKSQLLKFLNQVCSNPDFARSNKATVSPSMKHAYIDQNLSHLSLNLSVHDYLNFELSLGDQKTTSILVASGFPTTMQRTKLSALSQGQRARIAFLTLHLMEPNFYIMDEPTNHLDIEGQEQLEAEILEHGAASVIVSHDSGIFK